ncbi:MAG: BON domain-containing protein [Gammaproteobacteria bacterium]|nr:BON domain-containing protein [Gammaproteobacteria bacterium]MDH3767712.1 BON domain-containing protein [Gammaproteobacteria bacterium]
MSRWIALIIIGALVVLGASGCILVVNDEHSAHGIHIDKDSSLLARSIAKELDDDDSLRYSDISVSEDDGIVILHGDVDSVDSLQYAIDVAARYAGVETVVSKLSVEVDLD